MILTYRYRLLPTRRQHRALEHLLESQRQLYNAALQERIEAYRKRGLTRTYVDQTKALTEWRHSDEEAMACPLNLQRCTLMRLDRAYQGFFRRLKKGEKAGFPRFRGKGWFDSFGFLEFQGIRLCRGALLFKSMPGRLRVHFHRDLPPNAVIKNCAFKRGAKSWTVSFAVEVACQEARVGTRAVGVDVGILNFAALSDGGFVPSLRSARAAEHRLRVLQRALSRKKVRSGGRLRCRDALARSHSAVARRRAEHLHQASARLVRDYDTIALEKLNVGGLARGPLAKDVCDASWGKFVAMLRYKAARAGARLVEVDPRNTSQECSRCGMRVSKSLAQRQHDCPHCGLLLDRDLNAARNILKRAGVGPCLHNVAECGMRAGGNLSLGASDYRSAGPRHCPSTCDKIATLAS